MPSINKKYIEDFEKLIRDWERLKISPNPNSLKLVLQDVEQMQIDLRNIKL